MLLLSLVTATPQARHTVVSLGPESEPLVAPLRAAGAKVVCLGMQSPARLPAAARAVRREIGRRDPDAVQGWLYHGNLLLALAAPRGVPQFWSIHHSDLAATDPWHIRLTSRWLARLSKPKPRAIVYVAESSRRLHEDHGYAAARSRVIPNGVDLDALRPPTAEEARLARQRWGIPPTARVVGRAGRLHPMKDYPNFLAACDALLARTPDAHAIAWGSDIEPSTPSLAALLAASPGTSARIHLLGKLADTQEGLHALDLFCSSSSAGEAAPMVVLEAMACGVPCVVTDIGDCAAIVGDTGVVVPPGQPLELAAAMEKILGQSPKERAALGRRARERVAERFSLRQCAQAYVRLWSQEAAAPPA
ncbi:MAG: hypothetical protein QOI63_923, partial [Thermoplasmata archaeon]|jgi:glycosyltransferase involved in cell wall biosynthesis|nr:hypothetical protein [Thermoplasmata archaeon]